jgi:hypothetical protein
MNLEMRVVKLENKLQVYIIYIKLSKWFENFCPTFARPENIFGALGEEMKQAIDTSVLHASERNTNFLCS